MDWINEPQKNINNNQYPNENSKVSVACGAVFGLGGLGTCAITGGLCGRLCIIYAD
ncbi:hypothetical protein HYH85_09465 [Clostridium botulinum]|uniref:hypothetical protein n=1 Tax=Clostridium botulinum TaxID=1491 RepID=UPI001302082E|nr:hypothetical protein [Clostridium botulinum]MBY6796505.1 hypothetical protein [Clostridium botulinum]MBY6864562.1 hypothetical protein [Clostridium botulinum]